MFQKATIKGDQRFFVKSTQLEYFNTYFDFFLMKSSTNIDK